MKEKLFKKGITRRLFSVVLAVAVMITYLPVTGLLVYAADRCSKCVTCKHEMRFHSAEYGCQTCDNLINKGACAGKGHPGTQCALDDKHIGDHSATATTEPVFAETLSAINSVVKGNSFQVSGLYVAGGEWRINDENTLTITSLDSTKNIGKLVLNAADVYPSGNFNLSLFTGYGSGKVTYSGETLTISNLNVSTITISYNTKSAAYLYPDSVSIYYVPVAHTCSLGSKITGQAAECSVDGWNDYYQCTDATCGKIYAANNTAGTAYDDLDAWKASTAGKINELGHDWGTTPTYRYNAKNHWEVCSRDAGHAQNKEAHSGGTATCQAKAVCSTCNQEYGDLADHTYGTSGAEIYTCTVCETVDAAKKAEYEQNFAAAKEAAKAAIDEYVGESTDADAIAIANKAKQDIDSAETVEDVNDIEAKALEDIKDIIAPDFATLAKDLKYDGTEVKLTKDYTRAENQDGILIEEGQKVVIDLNGHTIDGQHDEYTDFGFIFALNSGGELVINDSTDNKGVITGGNGQFSLNTYRSHGGAINNIGGTVTINGGTFTGNVATQGGAVENGGKLTITGGVFTDNNAYAQGGAISNVAVGAEMLITGGTFTNNTAPYGGAVSNVSTKSCVIIGGTFTDNTATSMGGGILQYTASLTIGGSVVIKDNKLNEDTNNLEYYGGTVALDEETALTEDAEIGVTITAETDTLIAEGATLDMLKIFASDDTTKMFIVEDGALKIENIADHKHSFGETGEDRYNCQTCGAVDENEKAAVLLADAKEDAKDAISDAFAGCEENAVLDVAVKYFKAIDDAKTIDEVNKLKAEGIKAVKDAMHKHSYKKTIVKAATYNADGKAQYTCSCGDSYTKVISRLKVTSTVKYNNSTKLDAGFKVTSSTKDITVKWGKVADADGYMVYANYCGKDFKAIKTIKGSATTSYTFTKLDGKKLDLNKNIKVYVVAYKTIDGKKVEFGKSISGHAIGGWSRVYTNPTMVTVKNNKVTLAKGKTSTIKATVTYKYSNKKHISDKHAAEKRYRSSNKAVATVDANGKIKAVGKGTCTVYVFAKNGTSAKVTVTVK